MSLMPVDPLKFISCEGGHALSLHLLLGLLAKVLDNFLRSRGDVGSVEERGGAIP